jgi:hypothetical protein
MELTPVHGLEHAGQVPAALRRQRVAAPDQLAALAQRIVLDVLEAGEPVRQGAHVAAALHVVLAAERVEAAAVPADVPGQERQVDQGQDVVDRVVVLGDAEGPADHGLVGACVRVGQLADRGGGHAGLALGVVERIALDLRPVRLEVGRRPVDELAVREAGMDDLAPDRVGEGDVRPDVEPEPDVCPFGRARPARVDRVQACAVADAAQEVVEEDRVRLPGIRAPEHDQVGLFSLAI